MFIAVKTTSVKRTITYKSTLPKFYNIKLKPETETGDKLIVIIDLNWKTLVCKPKTWSI